MTLLRDHVDLLALARDLGVQYRYVDGLKRQREASVEAVMAMVAAMGVPIATPSQAKARRRELRKQRRMQLCPPVVVAWQGLGGRGKAEQTRSFIDVRHWVGRGKAQADAATVIRMEMTFEHGGSTSWELNRAAVRRAEEASGKDGMLRIALPPAMPIGVHRLTIAGNAPNMMGQAIVLSALPRVAQTSHTPNQALGVFAPLYALQSQHSVGAGDLHDLGALGDWAAQAGGSIVGTLPLMASFLDQPFDPSPYAPVSRLFGNELFVHLEDSPDLAPSESARRVLASAGYRRQIARLRESNLVMYREAYAIKHRLLTLLSDAAFASPQRRAQIERFVQQTEHAAEYAAFRSAVSCRGAAWNNWPPRETIAKTLQRERGSREFRVHLYSQFLFAEQLRALKKRSGDRWGLYLDYPVGVHAGGFDTWRFHELFAHDVCVGAPPDALYEGGQNWGFPPWLVDQTRADGHAYFRKCLRSLLAHASVLRIDHVMGLHRLFCIPPGFDGRDGMYVSQPAQELYAALLIESHRSGAAIVGENLGTVPPAVNTTLRKRGILSMHVQQFAFKPGARVSCPSPRPTTLASLNTHDTPTFAGFWNGHDINARYSLGLINAAQFKREQAARKRLKRSVTADLHRRDLLENLRAQDREVLDALHTHLARSKADITLITLEDLWLETRPQNLPGTGEEQPNWRRKLARSLDEIFADDALQSSLSTLNALRTQRVRDQRSALKQSRRRRK